MPETLDSLGILDRLPAWARALARSYLSNSAFASVVAVVENFPRLWDRACVAARELGRISAETSAAKAQGAQIPAALEDLQRSAFVRLAALGELGSGIATPIRRAARYAVGLGLISESDLPPVYRPSVELNCGDARFGGGLSGDAVDLGAAPVVALPVLLIGVGALGLLAAFKVNDLADMLVRVRAVEADRANVANYYAAVLDANRRGVPPPAAPPPAGSGAPPTTGQSLASILPWIAGIAALVILGPALMRAGGGK